MDTSMANKPLGYASTDANGNATAPVLTGNAQIGASPARTTYAGTSAAKPIVTLFTPQQYDGNPPSAGLTPWSDMMMLGGLQADSKAFFAVYGQPYGGGNNAVVDAVYMNGMSAGQGSGVSAGGFNTLLNYDNDDAAARVTRTGSTPPRFIASSSVTDPSGTAHAVTFSATGATFSPALPAYWGTMLRIGMSVVTNENGVAPGNIPQNPFSAPWLGNTFRRPFTTYFGTITGWQTNGDGSIAGVAIDGWVVPTQNSYGFGSASGAIPGTTTLDGSAPSLDTAFTQFSAPAIMFGVYTKAFLHYSLCDLEPQQAHGDINAPNGTIGSLVHECDDERDLWNHDPQDYVNSLHGYTVAVDNTNGGKLTSDSFGMWIAGGFALPRGFWASNLLPRAPAFTAMGSGNINQHNLYSPDTLGYAIGSAYTAQNWQFSVVDGGNITSNVRLTQYRDADVTASGATNDYTTASTHLMWKADGSQNPTDDTGTIGGQLVYNPPGYLYGIGIGAGGTFQSPNYGIVVDVGGYVHVVGGETVKGTLSAQANIVATGDVQTTQGFFRESLTTPASSSAPCTAGQFTDDANYHYVCVATNTWKRAALSSF